jgi:hypothetical protein
MYNLLQGSTRMFCHRFTSKLRRAWQYDSMAEMMWREPNRRLRSHALKRHWHTCTLGPADLCVCVLYDWYDLVQPKSFNSVLRCLLQCQCKRYCNLYTHTSLADSSEALRYSFSISNTSKLEYPWSTTCLDRRQQVKKDLTWINWWETALETLDAT